MTLNREIVQNKEGRDEIEKQTQQNRDGKAEQNQSKNGNESTESSEWVDVL